MQTVLLGAGASAAYSQSPLGVRMPIARNFFQTFHKTDLAENPWVLIDKLCGYLIDVKHVDPYTYLNSGIDIEELHSEIEGHLASLSRQTELVEHVFTQGAYTQLVFIFCALINAIQNGPISHVHERIAKYLKSGDTVLTFNWDTLMDRALGSKGWAIDTGYGVIPHSIFRDSWQAPDQEAPSNVKIRKLHGSTNWLTGYPLPLGDALSLGHALEPSSLFVYEYSQRPYDTYDGRYMEGYGPFSYGYYPPNLTHVPGVSAQEGHSFVQARSRYPWVPRGKSGAGGIPSMPLIIPPVKQKSYSMFGELFRKIWSQAEDDLAKADHIAVIGYSFPRTDHRSNELFKNAFSRRTSIPLISIINPDPHHIVEKFELEFGIPKSKIRVYKDYLSKEFPIEVVLAGD
jgi:hypothetical protein